MMACETGQRVVSHHRRRLTPQEEVIPQGLAEFAPTLRGDEGDERPPAGVPVAAEQGPIGTQRQAGDEDVSEEHMDEANVAHKVRAISLAGAYLYVGVADVIAGEG